MTQSVYLLGGAGTGKSTFMAALLARMNLEHGPLEDIHAITGGHGKPVTLRGHGIRNEDVSGYYLGVLRDGPFPGTDALERISHGAGAAWLREGWLPPIIVGEGATLGVRPFMYALNDMTSLLTLAFYCDPLLHDVRLMNRGGEQATTFVDGTTTRTRNMARDLEARGGVVHWVDSGDPEDWESALDKAETHLLGAWSIL